MKADVRKCGYGTLNTLEWWRDAGCEYACVRLPSWSAPLIIGISDMLWNCRFMKYNMKSDEKYHFVINEKMDHRL